MKKWAVAGTSLVLVGFACIYLFIPGRSKFQESTEIAVNARGFTRTFLQAGTWHKWWPSENATQQAARNAAFTYNGNTYTILQQHLTSVVIRVEQGNDTTATELFFIPQNDNKVKMTWKGLATYPVNPVKRVQHYIRTRQLRTDMETVLHKVHQFYLHEENLYGRQIRRERVRDSMLISATATTKGYPDTKTIYTLIDQLKAYAVQNNAAQTGLPMLNVKTEDSIRFFTRVALPINKKLKDSGSIEYRWMLGRGDILVTDVTGGLYNIRKAYVDMGNHIQDFRRAAPAIPFQSLVTDRVKEPDTAKWITRIYWPVM